MKFLLLLFSLFLVFPAWANTDKSQADKAYMDMVRDVGSMPAGFDFKGVRLAYTKTSFYSPFREITYKEELFTKVKEAQGGNSAVREKLETLMLHHFGHYKVHSYLATSPIATDADKAFHKWALKGLFDAIIDGQDGRTAASAFHVIETGEEYLLVRSYIKGKVKGQRLYNENGHVYDILNVEKDGQNFDVYFNIDIPFSSYPTSGKN